ncbi:hypothetical protein PAXRUDRAFT_829255 [Paxillus rubicundulus Ve08.2h10]|uniref:START domain-containing protein n=1 Tax=Paxillus rubicundulus Ve08.2h10 TaxID=930991 RepID=A0A0D0E659_9AGAM|nr:hypothetical protein PAXRUDRAFT_829255 [Paxillus rubicundulus Ve08.2h10]
MSDGTRLRQTWSDALGGAESNFRQLLTSYNSNEWKHVSLASDAPNVPKAKSRASLNPVLTDVVVHRRPTKSGENVYRVVLDVPATDESSSLDAWKAVLTTPELRQEWDPAVEGAHLVEMFDRRTRIAKTQFTLGWPANPRDAVTISRLHQDAATIIDISTSLPRSVDEPAYLRPSPPYVRSHVALFTWCIQVIQPTPAQPPTSPSDALKKRLSLVLSAPRLRITCFWQHDLRAVWNLGSSSSACQQLCTMMLGLYKTVKHRGSRIPMLAGYGYGVGIERMRFQLDRQALTVEYSVHPEEDGSEESGSTTQNLDELREHRRLTRSIEYLLPAFEGWDVQVSTKASSEKVEKLPWTAIAIRAKPPPSTPGGVGKLLEVTAFRITHAPLPNSHSILKVCIVLELSGPSRGIRLNGLPQTIQTIEERDPGSFFAIQQQQQQQLLQDASSTADATFQTSSSVSSVGTIGSGGTSMGQHLIGVVTERSVAAEKSILSRVKRSYIYFSSLLQEPEAKWKRTTEARGVSVTQLDSIDPTLVVYRAEATFVGLGLWDLYGALVSPGARVFWDKQHDDATLLEDVNELSELWHFKTKPAWPVVGRDTVLLKTVYKSPTTIHVFSFSAEDLYLFPSLPAPDPSIIRTQVDLQGWAIEALSPSTTQLTLLEQSDPKGWSNKATTIPAQMVGAVAGVGEFVIKCGGPPVVTRLTGARAIEMRYEHEKGVFRVAYEGSEGRKGGLNGVNGASGSTSAGTSGSGEEGQLAANSITTTSVHTIECEIRCDMDTWASSLDVVVDPPPQSVTALRRHRLSSLGGGLWLTLTHDALFASDERLLAIVRRGPINSARDKGVVMVNGARVTVDVEELPETELKALSKKKRVKPPRIPLDQPPIVSAIRRRRAEWEGDGTATSSAGGADTDNSSAEPSKPATPEPSEPKSSSSAVSSGWLSTPKFSSPLATFWSSAMEQATTTTQSAVAALSPTMGSGDGAVPSASKAPLQHVAEALHWLRELQSRPDAGWTLVSDKGFSVQRKLFPEISPLIPVHKGEKVIEGVSAEEVSSIVTSYDCRKTWDDKFGSAVVLEQFGAKCHTAFLVSKGGFPFRDRGFFVASLLARSKLPQAVGSDGGVGVGTSGNEPGSSQETRTVTFCVSCSFHPGSASSFSPSKYNPYTYPLGRVLIDGWVLETLDPYTKENYAIPSTRVTRIVAVDYAGSVPAAVNSMMNAGLARAVSAVEGYMKVTSPVPFVRLPAAGLVFAEQKAPGGNLGIGVETTLVVGVGVGVSSSGSSATWKLRRRDEQRVLIATKFDSAERVHTSLMLLTMSTPRSNGSTGVGAGKADESTARANKVTPNSLVSTPEVRPSGRTEFPSSAPTTQNPRRTSSASASSPSSEGIKPSSSSAFTIKGELKHTTDLIVAEMVVDTKLYSEGYNVKITSRVREATKFVPLPSTTTSLDQAPGNIVPPLGTGSMPTKNSNSDTRVLPISSSVYTVPASPLHSAGLNADRPPRHLLRLTLPTAQYQVSTVQDPLTGETRGAPPRPQWFLDLQERGFVVQVEIRPRGGAGGSGDLSGGGVRKNRNGGGAVVTVDGVVVGVAGEKESLTALGRDELQDDRVSRMLTLHRSADDGDVFPDELKVPLARADHYLLDRDTLVPAVEVSEHDPKTTEEDGPKQEDFEKGLALDALENGTVAQTLAPPSVSGGLLGFLNAYPNPLTRWTSSVRNSEPRRPSVVSSCQSSGAIPKLPGGLVEAEKRDAATSSMATATATTTYPLSSVLIIALIAFLIGSLLRSLLSPADFIYVVADAQDAEEVGTGWREIRRLVEVKYIVGGWDFQIAVVRRH